MTRTFIRHTLATIALLGMGGFAAAQNIPSAAVETHVEDRGDQPPSPSNDYDLSTDQINQLLERAENGNLKAIKELIAHYLIHEQDHETGFYWLERLGNLGDVDAQDAVIGYYESRRSKPSAKGHARKLRERWRRK
ncbi:MAG: hypothetical protein JNN30_06615 [Rhodanobacteraceae bacterium]|nr:hypothetical protein [Rhodanobacteraceae bacterium]